MTCSTCFSLSLGLVHKYVNPDYFIRLTMLDYLLFGLFFGFVCMIGDLTESFLKRSCSVKDAGAVIPGHGGILDRLDSTWHMIPICAWFINECLALNEAKVPIS